MGGTVIDARLIPPMERYYGPLGTHLAAHYAAGLAHCTLSFGAIEALLGVLLRCAGAYVAKHSAGQRESRRCLERQFPSKPAVRASHACTSGGNGEAITTPSARPRS